MSSDSKTINNNVPVVIVSDGGCIAILNIDSFRGFDIQYEAMSGNPKTCEQYSQMKCIWWLNSVQAIAHMQLN